MIPEISATFLFLNSSGEGKSLALKRLDGLGVSKTTSTSDDTDSAGDCFRGETVADPSILFATSISSMGWVVNCG